MASAEMQEGSPQGERWFGVLVRSLLDKERSEILTWCHLRLQQDRCEYVWKKVEKAMLTTSCSGPEHKLEVSSQLHGWPLAVRGFNE